jgi:hypothetical protein
MTHLRFADDIAVMVETLEDLSTMLEDLNRVSQQVGLKMNIISPLQYAVGHRPLQFLAISLDLRLLTSSFCQLSCANRHFT